MKRLFTLIVLLGLTAGVLAGCSPSSDTTTTPKAADTNAAPAMPSTNK